MSRYPDNPSGGIENPDIPFSEPQSPTVPHLRHHQPTVEHDRRDPSTTGLRQRNISRGTSPIAVSSTMMRIQVQTPFSDMESNENGRRKEVVVDRSIKACELKDRFASGQWDNGTWIREGMRLVWRGRIVRDDEVLGEVVKDTSDSLHIFHIVARRIESSTPLRSTPSISQPDQANHETRPTASSSHSFNPPSDRATIALHDSLHYLFFLARHHLCCLLGSVPLAWQDTYPPPIIEQETARQAVMSVLSGVARTRSSREEGWENWRGAFEEVAALEKIERSATESEVRSLWSSLVGRSWKDGIEGEQVAVELDEIQYMLHLPPLPQISSFHLFHLLLYLRLTTLIPLFSAVVEHESRITSQPAIPQPTRTIPAHPNPERVRVLLRLRIPAIPMSVLLHMAYSGIKIAGMLWMLTRGMKWDDVRFWMMAGAAGGWWIADGVGAWNRARPRAAPRPRPADGEQAGEEAGAGVEPGNLGPPEHGQGQMNANGVGRANAAGLAPTRAPTFSSTTAFIPLLHLRTDAAQLGHPSTDLGGTTTSTPTRRQPSWLSTQFLLPLCLWFITLIPEWENIRARAIRRRERAMRIAVGEATAASALEGAEAEGQRENVYPEGLNAVAKRYYQRVMARGEGVDWEEEREAQRALGIPDEDEGGDEMRMRML